MACRARRFRPSRSTTIWSACCTVETTVGNQDCSFSAARIAPGAARMRSSVSRYRRWKGESSRIKIFGSRITARAPMAERCFWAAGKCDAALPPTMVSNFAGNSSISAAMAGDPRRAALESPWSACAPPRRNAIFFRAAFSLKQESILRQRNPPPARSFFKRPFPDRPPVRSAEFPEAPPRAGRSMRLTWISRCPWGPTIARIDPAGTCREISSSTGLFTAACPFELAPFTSLRTVGYRKRHVCGIRSRREFSVRVFSCTTAASVRSLASESRM